MATLKLIVNFSLIFSLLIAPCIMLIAYWYRGQFQHTLIAWKRPEMVVVTIIFSVLGLILFVVGISCFFSYGGYLQSREINKIDKDIFLYLGVICGLMGMALAIIYAALRLLLVQIIMERGIVVNNALTRIPNVQNIIEWHEISDYYLVSDYPNVVFNLITQRKRMDLSRMILRVPVYLREDFEQLLETRIYSASATRARLQMTQQKYSEN